MRVQTLIIALFLGVFFVALNAASSVGAEVASYDSAQEATERLKVFQYAAIAAGAAFFIIFTAFSVWTRVLRHKVKVQTSELQDREKHYEWLFHGSSVAMQEEDFSGIFLALADLRTGGTEDLRDYLADHEDFARQLFETIKTLDANEAALQLCGAADTKELVAKIKSILSDDIILSFAALLVAMWEGRANFSAQVTLKTLKGEVKNTVFTFPLPKTAQEAKSIPISIIDITESKRAEEKIKGTLNEKEVLLQEIHHRVKNNLQVVAGMLALQANTESDERVVQALEDSERRVEVMSKIHENLYRSSDLSNIDVREYLSSVVVDAGRGILSKADRIVLYQDIETITLSADQAIPLGQIVSELISNATKHAFPGNEVGRVHVVLRRMGGGKVELLVRDDGVGLPDGVDIFKSSSLGLRLVTALARTLGGGITVDTPDESETGCTFRIVFKETQPT